MQSHHDAELEQTFGPLARNREHNPGDHISYRMPGEEGEYSGVILWVCAKNDRIDMCYVVLRDGAGDSFPDVCFPAYVDSWQ